MDLSERKKRRYSYSDQRERRSRFLSGLFVASLIFLAFVLVNGLFVSSYLVSSSSMAPALLKGDRLLVSPLAYGPRTAFSDRKLPGLMKPRRGDLVLAEAPSVKRLPPGPALLESLIRFLSFQRLGRRSDSALPVVKRVVGLPGDSVSIVDSVLRVRREGQPGAMSEFELVSKPYDSRAAILPDSWTNDLPFSANMAEFTLGPDQYFLMNDDRSMTGDSRSWGAVASERILAKVLFRYWPLRRK